ncbi:uncharacterized protein BXZ73DRAFT_82911 [Epithele typhae]|uniref:uncharacterized protein n=1 Tax=Epithele typhae TaxID=378194 RepID=UPI002007F25B|nr:uncharacterized protein BXZ73DRAFT_82911 [Epithele typhae]KAH9911228.1 hypothetical protein BXZ73DRAFT_82911 [Epithele typhae]
MSSAPQAPAPPAPGIPPPLLPPAPLPVPEELEYTEKFLPAPPPGPNLWVVMGDCDICKQARKKPCTEGQNPGSCTACEVGRRGKQCTVYGFRADGAFIVPEVGFVGWLEKNRLEIIADLPVHTQIVAQGVADLALTWLTQDELYPAPGHNPAVDRPFPHLQSYTAYTKWDRQGARKFATQVVFRRRPQEARQGAWVGKDVWVLTYRGLRKFPPSAPAAPPAPTTSTPKKGKSRSTSGKDKSRTTAGKGGTSRSRRPTTQSASAAGPSKPRKRNQAARSESEDESIPRKATRTSGSVPDPLPEVPAIPVFDADRFTATLRRVHAEGDGAAWIEAHGFVSNIAADFSHLADFMATHVPKNTKK